MNKKSTLIIGLQSLLIIALCWFLVFYGKDEYETYQANQTEEIESPGYVETNQGISIVSLPLATQRNSGILTAKVLAANYRSGIKSMGSVVPIDSLIDAKSNYLTIRAQIELARGASQSNLTQYTRLQALNADDKNVSDLAVQQALALVNADKANIAAAKSQLQNLQNSIKLQWGEVLASLVFKDKLAPHLADLLNRKNVLVQVNLPLNTDMTAAGSMIKLLPINQTQVNQTQVNQSQVDQAQSEILAVYISPATTADTTGFGKTFYYSAPAHALRLGMRVNVEVVDTMTHSGVVIPDNAVVWYGGKPWAYFKQGKTPKDDDQFVRKPISTDLEVTLGWFNQGFNESDEVVVSGAQLLLSEEFKYLIKNENED